MILAVAGMHRSGTSMLARYLHHAGICMGTELYEDRTTNPYGHYEDVEFLTLQRRELARAFDGEDYLVHRDFVPSEEFLEGARRLLEARRSEFGSRSWGWKDPRTTLFLDEWKRLEPDLLVVALVREPRRVVDSLCARLRGYRSIRKKELFLRTYAHYNAKIVRFLERHPGGALVLSLERLVEDPSGALGKLSDASGHRFDPALFRELFDPKVLSRKRRAALFLNRRGLREAEAIHRELVSASL
jgi:hypothetical protein